MHLDILLWHALSSELQCIRRRRSIAHHNGILIVSRPAAFSCMQQTNIKMKFGYIHTNRARLAGWQMLNDAELMLEDAEGC